MIILIALAYNYHVNQAYKFSDAELRLLSKTSVDKSKITYKDGKLSYNRDSESTVGGQKITVSSATNSTGKMPYKVMLASMASEGIEFSDSTNDLPFKVIPASATGEGRYINNRMVYRVKGGKGVYTLRRNGIKEDIILTKAPGDSVTYKWKLELGDKLEAKMLHNGSVGIYSADPLLSSSSLQVSDAKSQSLIDNARKNGKKTYLQYLIPRPYFKDGQGKLSAGGVGFSLSGNVLTLTATGLKDKKYPLSIDPTVVTTTTADFATGYDDGNIDYSTADEIDRAGVGTGLVGAWNYTSNSTNNGATFSSGFISARYYHATVAYNGYLYIIGGNSGTSGNDCTAGSSPYYCNGVQFAPINADGTIGTWHFTHNSTDDGTGFVAGFTVARAQLTSVAYNGYLYIFGGLNGSASSGGSDCLNTPDHVCGGVQYAPINTDGTIGTWHFTHNSTDDGTTYVSGINTARYGHTTVEYNGYMYVIGGSSEVSSGDCVNLCNGVQFAPINANGTIGTWHFTHNFTDDGTTFSSGFTQQRYGHTSVAYNGYLYVIGGQSGSSANDCAFSLNYCSGVQYAPINANGTIGAWHYTHSSTDDGTSFSAGFTQPRWGHTSVAYNGYLYVMGGNATASSDCTVGSGFCSGVQYAPINANGTIGAWHYTHSSTDDGTSFSAGFTQGRNSQSTAVYNGNLYIIGGHDGQAANDCSANYCSGVQFASLTTLNATAGPVGSWNYTSNSTNNGATFSAGFVQPRKLQTSVAYNGYLYVIGGETSSSGNDCTSANNDAGFSCNGVQYAPINSDGTIGAWKYTYNSNSCSTWTSPCNNGLLSAQFAHASVAYNGYLYVVGGGGSTGAGDCVRGGGTFWYCNGVQYAPINSDGTIGAWKYTYNSNSCSTWTSPCNNGFNYARSYMTSVVSGGYIYLLGGLSPANTADCTTAAFADYWCNGVQYAPINPDGTLGAWHYTHNSTDDSTSFVSGFTSARFSHTSVTYNGFIYVAGGQGVGSDCNFAGGECKGVQFAKVNANGTLGAWHYTHNSTDDSTTFVAGLNNTILNHTMAAYNGYMYILGGQGNGVDCSVSYCSGVQFAKINANGTLGTWDYTSAGADNGISFSAGFVQGRYGHTSVTYNGYIYVIGGKAGSTSTECTANYCNGVQFASIFSGNSPSFGTDGSWNYTHNSTNDGATFSGGFYISRIGHASVAYNGYLYVIGGETGSSSGDCTTGTSTFSCNGVQFAKINSDGTIGTWNYTHNSTNDGSTFVAGFTQGRNYLTSVAYNGYVYILGGYSRTSANDCVTGTGPYYCNGVQFAKINSDGTIGTWNYTHSSTNDGSSFSGGFTRARVGHASVVYNGYLYVIGGVSPTNGDDCPATFCNGVQFAKINSDGTIGTWNYTHSSTNDGSSFSTGFTQARRGHTAVAYKGYLYISGGFNTTNANDCTSTYISGFLCSGTQYAQINSDGTIGAWSYTANSASSAGFSAGFTQPRYQHTATAYNGYLYIAGGNGITGNDCSASQQCNGVQYASINSNGTLGVWHYTHGGVDDGTVFSTGFTNARSMHSSVAYNGYLYVIGGNSLSAINDCASSCNGVQFTSLNSPAQNSTYEKIVDTGSTAEIVSLSFNGQAACGVQINYKVGDSTGNFGSTSSIYYGLPGNIYNVNQAGRYIWVQFRVDDSACGSQTRITDFTITYNYSPAAPTLSAPADGATGVKNLQFNFKTTDADSDYLRYKIELCSTSNCSAIAATLDQTISQSGWSGQDQQSNTAYTGATVIASSTTAVNTYTGALTKNAQYWWRAYAIDPAGSNTWSSASAIQTFTTGDSTPAAPTLIYPVSASTGNSVFTTFQLRSTESNGDYLRYWIDVCADNTCSSIIRSICQTNTGTGVPGICSPSQTGWASQDQQAGTAYTGSPTISSSTLATHNYQSPYLTKNTTYWWRAYAIDPGGSNTWSSASAIQPFTTAPTETHIQGNIHFQGSVKL